MDNEKKLCKHCGVELRTPSAAFCWNCGEKIPQEKTCPSCGKDLPAAVNFCMYCGTALSGNTTEEKLQADMLQRDPIKSVPTESANNTTGEIQLEDREDKQQSVIAALDENDNEIPNKEKEKKRSHKKLAVGIAAAVLVLVLGLLTFLHKSTDQDTANSTDLEQGEMISDNKQQERVSTNGQISQPKDLVDIYEDDNCLIQYYKFEFDSGRANMLFRVKNKTDRVLTFQSDCISINGESIEDTIMSDDVSPNSNGTISMRIENYEEEYFDFSHISKLSGNFRIIDFDDDNFHNGDNSYTIEYMDIEIPGAGTPSAEGAAGENIYSDYNVDIAFLHVEDNGDDIDVVFRVKNKTQNVLTIQCAALCINGESASDIIASENIAPNSTGNISISCEFNKEFVDLNDISSINGKLRIIDFDNDYFYNGEQSYEVSFER